MEVKLLVSDLGCLMDQSRPSVTDSQLGQSASQTLGQRLQLFQLHLLTVALLTQDLVLHPLITLVHTGRAPFRLWLPPLEGSSLSWPMWTEVTFREARELGGIPAVYFPEMIPQARGDHVMAPIPASRRAVKWTTATHQQQKWEGGFQTRSAQRRDVIFTQKHSPILWDSSGSWTSTFSLWNMWYSACSQMGGIWLNCRAIEYASFIQYRQPSQLRRSQEPPPGPPRDPQLTMISMELHLEVPQYRAIPWLITWVMALTVSSKSDQQQQTGGTIQTRLGSFSVLMWLN